MKQGIVVGVKYSKHDNYIYTIKTEDNKKFDSIEYSKFGKRLKQNEKVSFNIIEGKAKILNDEITAVKNTKKEDLLILLLILLIIFALGSLYLLNIISSNLFFIIVVIFLIVYILDSIISSHKIYKNGKIEEAIVIDKEQIYTASDNGPSWRYHYELTIRLNTGIQMTGLIPFSKHNQKIEIGSKIKVKIYKNNFIIWD